MYNDERHALRSTIKTIDSRLLDLTETVLIKTPLYGNCSLEPQIHRFLMQPLTILQLLKDFMYLCFILDK